MLYIESKNSNSIKKIAETFLYRNTTSSSGASEIVVVRIIQYTYPREGEPLLLVRDVNNPSRQFQVFKSQLSPIGYFRGDQNYARDQVLGRGSAGNSEETNLYSFLTAEDLQRLGASHPLLRKPTAVGLQNLIRKRRIQREEKKLRYCRALDARLNRLIFARTYVNEVRGQQYNPGYPGVFPPPPETLREFLRDYLLYDLNDPERYGKKRLLGNSDWKENDLLFQYCELGLCPEATRYESDEQFNEGVRKMGLSPEKVHSEWGYGFGVKSNSGLGNAYGEYYRASQQDRENPLSTVNKNLHLLENRVYFFRGENFSEDSDSADSVEAFIDSITSDLIRYAQNPALCEPDPSVYDSLIDPSVYGVQGEESQGEGAGVGSGGGSGASIGEGGPGEGGSGEGGSAGGSSGEASSGGALSGRKRKRNEDNLEGGKTYYVFD